MGVSAVYKFQVDATETLALSEDLAADVPMLFQINGAGVATPTLTATTSPPVTKAWGDDVTLSGGAVTLDLAALVRAVLPNVDFTGLKVQLIHIKAAAANTAALKFDVGASNGYGIFGSATSEISLDADDEAAFFFNDKLPDVAAGAKDIDVSSSDVDAKFKIVLVAG